MYNIEIYEDKNGKSEIKEYIRNLKQKESKDSNIKLNKIISYMRILSEKGLSMGEPYIKHIKDDIWELRPLRDRILFAYCRDNTFILFHVFLKQTQKTPQRQIEKAKKLLEDYKKRRGLL